MEMNTASWALSTLNECKEELNLKPEYQRSEVWIKSQSNFLYDSINNKRFQYDNVACRMALLELESPSLKNLKNFDLNNVQLTVIRNVKLNKMYKKNEALGNDARKH